MHVHSHIHQIDSVLQFYSSNKCTSTHTFTNSTQCYNFIHQTVHAHSHIHQLNSVLQFTKQVHVHSHIHSQSISHSVSRSLINSLTRSLTLSSLTRTFLAFSTVPVQQLLLRQSHKSLETGTGTSIIALPFSLSSPRATTSSSSVASVSRDGHGNVHNSSALQS